MQPRDAEQGVINIPGGMVLNGTRFHPTTQNSMQFEPYELEDFPKSSI